MIGGLLPLPFIVHMTEMSPLLWFMAGVWTVTGVWGWTIYHREQKEFEATNERTQEG